MFEPGDEDPIYTSVRGTLAACSDGVSYVAVSGGSDSLALAFIAAKAAAACQDVTLRLVHVNHHLQPAADAWARQVRKVAERLRVPLDILSVSVDENRGGGQEEAARAARYRAIAGLVDAERDQVLTAHHRGDQAETVLLRLVRGAGVEGLGAMAPESWSHGFRLVRPWLDIDPELLKKVTGAAGLNPVSDPSNSDDWQFDRAFVRHQVLPLLSTRWPQAATAIARSASQHREATDTLTRLAQRLLQHCQGADPWQLSRERVRTLPSEDAMLLLRHWFKTRGARSPGAARLAEITRQALTTDLPGEHLQFAWDGYVLRNYRTTLYFERDIARDDTLPRTWDCSTGDELTLSHGRLLVERRMGSGLRLPMGRQVTLNYRRDGERVKNGATEDRPGHQSLKKLMQTLGVPPWLRHSLPLVYINDEVAVIPGHRTLGPWAAAADEEGWVFSWEPVC